jgi:hypothetical protein
VPRAAGSLLKNKRFLEGKFLGFFDDLVESTLLAGGKSKTKRWKFRGFS